MNVTSTTHTQTAKEGYITQTSNNLKSNATKEEEKTTSVYQELGKDTFEKTSESDYPETYKPIQKNKLSSKEIAALKDQQKANEADLMKKFIGNTVNNQKKASSASNTHGNNADLLINVFGSIDAAYPPVGSTPEEAKAAISEGGAYSIGAVSDRIMTLAKAIAGDDETKIQEMRDAVTKGFKMAGFDVDKPSESKLPQICIDTCNEVFKRFDEWQNKSSDSTQTSNTNL